MVLHGRLHDLTIYYVTPCHDNRRPWSPPRPAYEEFLENELVSDDHVVDVLTIC